MKNFRLLFREYLLTACADGYFYIWQALTGMLIRKETYEMEFSSIGGIGRCVSCEFSPSGNKFLINWFGKDRNHLAVYKFDQFEIDSECTTTFLFFSIFSLLAERFREKFFSFKFLSLNVCYTTRYFPQASGLTSYQNRWKLLQLKLNFILFEKS